MEDLDAPKEGDIESSGRTSGEDIDLQAIIAKLGSSVAKDANLVIHSL